MAKKSGLGRGLSSLISEAAAESGVEAATNELPIESIIPNSCQPRKHFDEDALQELSDSIKAVGVLQPLIVRESKGKYQIIAGERRYQAAKLAGLGSLPVIIKDLDEVNTLKIALIENLQRKDLNPIEEAKGFKELIRAADLTQEELAQSVSKSRSAIANALRLLDLPEAVQDFLYQGELTAGHARAILAVPDDDKRIALANKVVEEKLSVRETERLAPLFSVNQSETRTKTITPKSYKIAARSLKEFLSTPVKVKSVRGKNKIEIEFSDEEDLSRILEIIEGVED